MRREFLCTLGTIALLLACGGEDRPAASADQSGGAEPEAASTPGATGEGAIVGTVSFTGTPPANPTIDMSEEPACQAKHAGTPTDPRVVVAAGKLANTFVYVKSGLPANASYAVPATPVVLDQDGCEYEPRVFGLMVGQELEIRNSDPLLHNIKAVPKENRGFNISQPRAGMETTRTFSRPEVMVPLECNVHGWMSAHAGVLDHPYFATSGPDGSFRITGLPAGSYELEAWHETLGTRTAQVTVPATGEVTTEFTFAPTT